MRSNINQSVWFSGRPEEGFTLVELMIAMALSAVVVVMIASAYWAQSRSSRGEMMEVGVQQNMRTAMFFLQRDLMMAGFDVDVDDTTVQPTFLLAQDDANGNPQLQFQYNADDDGLDNDGDGVVDNPDEVATIFYRLFDSAADPDGDTDDLQRQAGGQAIAGNIEEMEFLYTRADGTQSTAVTGQGNLNQIQSVGISLLVRTESPTQGSDAIHSYQPLSNPITGTVWGPYNDGFPRQILTATVVCRNRL